MTGRCALCSGLAEKFVILWPEKPVFACERCSRLSMFDWLNAMEQREQ